MYLHAALLHVGSSDEERHSDVKLVWHGFTCTHSDKGVSHTHTHTHLWPQRPVRRGALGEIFISSSISYCFFIATSHNYEGSL